MINLRRILERFPPAATRGLTVDALERPLRRLTHRAERIRADDLFAAFKDVPAGLPAEVVVLAAALPPGDGPAVVYPDLEQASRELSLFIHGRSLEKLRLAGVTGTNGKSSVVDFGRQVFALARPESRAASLGTLGMFLADGNMIPSPNTTPFPLDLHPMLAEAAERGARLVFLEASSHALEQGRLAGLVLSAAACTNITRDHLDYHRTPEAYAAAKRRILGLLSGPLVLNADCPASAGFRHEPVLRFGLDNAADLRLADLVPDEGGFGAILERPDGPAIPVRLPFLGRHNASNILCALALARALGLPLEEAAATLPTLRLPRGRLQRVAAHLPGRVFIDYAHTPDAMERIIRALREHLPGRRLRILFGCGGDRDRGKRPLMGRAAAACEEIILTSDNSRSEDTLAILAEIRGGLNGARTRTREIPDRQEAILQALETQREGDVLLLAGKGHETEQVVGAEHIPFDEERICEEFHA